MYPPSFWDGSTGDTEIWEQDQKTALNRQPPDFDLTHMLHTSLQRCDI
jgi:hypothetical protein